MPLRDHFRPPVSQRSSWEGFHGQWPAIIVQQLRRLLPPGYVAEPRVRLGTAVEIDVGTLETGRPGSPGPGSNGSAGASASAWAESADVAVAVEPPEEYEYEVRVYDAERDRRLVAAIELVSPANKDRPDSRAMFVTKCLALLRSGVAVSIVDLVTNRHFNLYAQLMATAGHPSRTMSVEQPPTYAASARWTRGRAKPSLESWSLPLVIGQPLPTLPLWLAEEKVVPLDLEASYEQACRDLWID
jgi:hypothetical protein